MSNLNTASVDKSIFSNSCLCVRNQRRPGCRRSQEDSLDLGELHTRARDQTTAPAIYKSTRFEVLAHWMLIGSKQKFHSVLVGRNFYFMQASQIVLYVLYLLIVQKCVLLYFRVQ